MPACSRCRVTTGSGTAAPASRRRVDDSEQGQPWTATTYSLLLLRDLGLDPRSDEARGAIALVRENSRWEEGDQPFFDGEVEPCINGMAVALGAYFGENVDGVVARLLGEQLADGGWNCEAERGSTRSSFATTINVLEGLLEHERATGGSPALGRGPPAWRGVPARARAAPAQEHRRADRPGTGCSSRSRPAGTTTCSAASSTSGPSATPRTTRMAEAVEVLRSKRQPDGTWLLENTHPGPHPFRHGGRRRTRRAGGTRSGRCGYSRWYEQAHP